MVRMMKDSGIEWIGKIPEDWQVERLQWNMEEIVEKNSPVKMEMVLSLTKEKGVIPYDEKGNQGNKSKENLEEYKIAYCDTIVANSMNILIGSVGISKYDGCVSPVYYVFKNNNKTDLRFLNYIFSTTQFQKQLRKFANGILEIRLRVSSENIMKQLVAFPSITEQAKISDFLDEKTCEIDSLITKTKESIEEYKKYKQSVITERITKGIDEDVCLMDSKVEYLGKIPEHWNIVPLSVLLQFIGGYAYKSERFCEETNNQVIRIGNVKNDYFILDEKQVFIDDEYALESEKCKIVENDILFTMTGTKGKKDYFYTLVVKNEHLQNRKLFINQRVGCFRAITDKVYMPYYNYLLKYEPLLEYIFLFETGTANQGNLGIESISTLKLLLPPLKEQKEIVKCLDKKCAEIDALITKKESFVEEMETYKKSLIYEYVTGKKEVK